jgi:hypothetical protein
VIGGEAVFVFLIYGLKILPPTKARQIMANKKRLRGVFY